MSPAILKMLGINEQTLDEAKLFVEKSVTAVKEIEVRLVEVEKNQEEIITLLKFLALQYGYDSLILPEDNKQDEPNN